MRSCAVAALAVAFAGCATTPMATRERIRAGFGPPETTLGSSMSIPEQRVAWENGVARAPLAPGVAVSELEGPLPGLMLVPASAVPGRLVIHFHGGGFVSGSAKTHLALGSRLARSARARVMLVNYRLAPEEPFPAARDDALTAYRWVLAHGFDARRIVLSGDSAGGHVVMTALLQLRAAGEPLPAGLVLISPWLDLAQRGESMRTRAAVDPTLLEQDLADCARLYLAGRDALAPEVSPLDGDLSGLPPMLIHVGDDEILRSDSTRLAQRVRAAGGHARLHAWPKLWHVFHSWAPDLPEANQAIEEIAAFVQRRAGS